MCNQELVHPRTLVGVFRSTSKEPRNPSACSSLQPSVSADVHAADDVIPFEGLVPVVNLLLGYGADPTLQDKLGWTPVHLASKAGHVGIVKALELATHRHQNRHRRHHNLHGGRGCADSDGGSKDGGRGLCSNSGSSTAAMPLSPNYAQSEHQQPPSTEGRDWYGRTHADMSAVSMPSSAPVPPTPPPQSPLPLPIASPWPTEESAAAKSSVYSNAYSVNQNPQNHNNGHGGGNGDGNDNGNDNGGGDGDGDGDGDGNAGLTSGCTVDVLEWKLLEPTHNKHNGQKRAHEHDAHGPVPSSAPSAQPATVQRPTSTATLVDRIWAEYIATGTPVLIKGGAAGWGIQRWTPDYLRGHAFGSMQFPVSAVPYSEVYGGGVAEQTTLADFVDHIVGDNVHRHTVGSPGSTGSTGSTDAHAAVPYIFCGLRPEDEHTFAPDLAESYAPPFLGSKVEFQQRPPQFYLGPSGSAAPMHYHEDAFNALAYGRKHWVLLPPSHASFSTVPGMAWLKQQQQQVARPEPAESARFGRGKHHGLADSLHCTQEAGDVLYVPHGWGHAVVNLQASVGVAVNFEHPFRTF